MWANDYFFAADLLGSRWRTGDKHFHLPYDDGSPCFVAIGAGFSTGSTSQGSPFGSTAGSGGSSGGGSTPSDLIPDNPCAYMGRALPPSAYAAQGANAANPISLWMDKRGWPRGGFLDAQPMASGTVQQRRAYGNYVFGVYMQAAGIPLSLAWYEANEYAGNSGANYDPQADGPMDTEYTNLPAANITNIANGYNAQATGKTCHR